MKKFLSTAAIAGFAVVALASCGGKATQTLPSDAVVPGQTKAPIPTTLTPELVEAYNEAYAGDYNLTMWVSESEGVADLTKEQIAKFNAKFSKINVTVEVSPVSEADAAGKVITDVATAPDMYCFAQDQLARLVQANGLNAVHESAVVRSKAANDSGANAAATTAGKTYAFPLTSDNGYFMYYDKSIVKEEHLDSIEDILADCEKAGRKFSYEAESGAWYNAGWFFATGCHSSWTTNADGDFVSYDDDFNSANGIIALRGMQHLLKSAAYNSSSNTGDFGAAEKSAVVISGTWGAEEAKKQLGENYAATDLPSFTVDGKSYHLGSFSGNKLMGCKPHNNNEKADTVCDLLAEFLTNYDCQLERFNAVGWGPSNKQAQADPKVQADPALCALAKQSEYAIPQGQIDGSWWDSAKTYAVAAKAATQDDTAALQKALDDYTALLKKAVELTPEQRKQLSAIGSMADTGWGTDFELDAVDGVANTYKSRQKITFKEGDEFKIRKGYSWTNNWGSAAVAADDTTLGDKGGNILVNVSGTFYVVVTTDKDGNVIKVALEA